MNSKKTTATFRCGSVSAEEVKVFLGAVESYVNKTRRARIDWQEFAQTESHLDRKAADCKSLWRELAYREKAPADDEDSDIEGWVANAKPRKKTKTD